MSAPIYTPTNSARVSPFSVPWTTFVISCLLKYYNNHSNRCEMTTHCVLICISLMITDIEHLFFYVSVIFILSVKKMSLHIFCPFLKSDCLLLICMSSLHMSDTRPWSDIRLANISSYSHWLPSHFDGFLCCADVFQFTVRAHILATAPKIRNKLIFRLGNFSSKSLTGMQNTWFMEISRRKAFINVL